MEEQKVEKITGTCNYCRKRKIESGTLLYFRGHTMVYSGSVKQILLL
jgi:hypothetical protein